MTFSGRGSLLFHCSVIPWNTSTTVPHISSRRNCTLSPRKATTIAAGLTSSFEPAESFRSVCSLVVALAMTIGLQGAPSSQGTFEDVPRTLSGGGEKGQRIQKPKSAEAESCTSKCVSTCIRGGAGAPGEGPLNVGRPLVVFKEGFRSRQYCLIECSEICNLIGDGS